MAGVPEEMKLKILTSHFSGGPLEYLKQFNNKGMSSWNDFKVILRNIYTPVDHQKKLKTELVTMKHYGNFENLTRKFLLLVNQQVDGYNEQQKIIFFLNALSPETKHDVENRDPQTLRKAIELATRF